MIETPWVVGPGFALGLLFYGGLWWTVRHMINFRRPALTVLASVVLRIGVVLVGLYVLADGEWLRMVLSLLGFLLARLAVMWAIGLPSASRSGNPHHAP